MKLQAGLFSVSLTCLCHSQADVYSNLMFGAQSDAANKADKFTM